MEASIINDVNEPVFLLESGWIPSSCYDIIVRTHQGPHLGQEDIRMQVDADHHGINHANHGQFILIQFSEPVPDGASMMVNGYPVEFYPGNNTLCRGVSSWHQNPTDKIGAGDLILSFVFPENWSSEQKLAFASHVNDSISSISATDWSFRDYL